jgi:hypothetical protein
MLTWFPQLQKYVIYIQIEEMLLEVICLLCTETVTSEFA